MALHKTHSKAWHLVFHNDTVPHSVTLGLLETQNTKEFLELLGFRQTAEDGPSIRMEVGDGGSGRTIDLLAQPDVPPGTWTHANGIHHHFAVATDTEAHQLEIKDYLEGDGYVDVSDQKDRFYFKSIYVRSPGGVLIEVATPSNYLRDEPEAELGSHLMYPPWLEHHRGEWDPSWSRSSSSSRRAPSPSTMRDPAGLLPPRRAAHRGA